MSNAPVGVPLYELITTGILPVDALVPVKVIVDLSTKAYEITIGTPPASQLIIPALKFYP